ncbi:peptide chain release factor H [Sphingopyxis sp.]|uniref:peptide chain release factor H n=1 Tax=Sphingopyxis sp. TaxID=1908224 RepID=UPI003D0FAB80
MTTEIIMHLSSGGGPAECRWVLARLVRAFVREAQGCNALCEPLEPIGDDPASLLLRVSGSGAESFAQDRTGTILWTGQSPFRPTHKRKNWFVGVSRVGMAEEAGDLRDTDIDYQAMRASGPGGQHVNKTDSAVRATHRPTGLVAVSQEQRSQHANRKVARLKLALLLAERAEAAEGEARRAAWDRNQSLERGNAVRTYAGSDFRLKRQ